MGNRINASTFPDIDDTQTGFGAELGKSFQD